MNKGTKKLVTFYIRPSTLGTLEDQYRASEFESFSIFLESLLLIGSTEFQASREG